MAELTATKMLLVAEGDSAPAADTDSEAPQQQQESGSFSADKAWARRGFHAATAVLLSVAAIAGAFVLRKHGSARTITGPLPVPHAATFHELMAQAKHPVSLKDQPMFMEPVQFTNRSLLELAEKNGVKVEGRRMLQPGGDPCMCLPTNLAQECNAGTADALAESAKQGSRCLKQAHSDYLWCYVSSDCPLSAAHQSNAGSCKWKLASWFDCIHAQPGRPVQIPTDLKVAQAACAFDIQSILLALGGAGLALEKVTEPDHNDYDLAIDIIDAINSFLGAATGLIATINNCRIQLPPVVTSICALDILDMISNTLTLTTDSMTIDEDCAGHTHDPSRMELRPEQASLRQPSEIYDTVQTGTSRERASDITSCTFGAYGAVIQIGYMGIRFASVPEACEGPDATNYTCAMQTIALINDFATIGGALAGMVSDCPIEDLTNSSAACAADIITIINVLINYALAGDAVRTDCKNISAETPYVEQDFH